MAMDTDLAQKGICCSSDVSAVTIRTGGCARRRCRLEERAEMSLTGPDVETILLTARSSSPLQTYETSEPVPLIN